MKTLPPHKQYLCSLLLLGQCMLASAAVLDYVPMQGTMVHVNITFTDTSTGTFGVVIDPPTVTLTPLAVSNPADTFDPSAAWYDPLQGMSFSRRYGFVVGDANAPLPSGTGISIRWLESSPGLNIYNYRRSGDFSGIFGTDGSNAVFAWNLLMYHPVFVAPASTNSHFAHFEVFLANTNTGLAMPGYSSTTFRLNLANLPEPLPPVLSMTRSNGMMSLQWSSTPIGFTLESIEHLQPGAVWVPVTTTPVTNMTHCTVLVPCDSSTRFYRLRKTLP